MIDNNHSVTSPNIPRVGIAFLLSQVGAHAAFTFEERLVELDLAPHHAGLLRMLGVNPGLIQKELSDLFGIFPSRLVTFLDQLQERGLIERRADPSDRRRHRLYLTGAGQEILEQVQRLTGELEDELLESLSADDRDVMSALLRRVVERQGIRPAVHPAYRKLQDPG